MWFKGDMWNDPRIQSKINNIVDFFKFTIESRYADETDLFQEALITVWSVATANNGDGDGVRASYLHKCILNRIRRVATESSCVATAPYRVKQLASKYRASGAFIPYDLEWHLRPLIKCVQLNQLDELACVDPLPYSILSDILGITTLTEEERRIIVSKVEGTTDKLGIAPTSLQRKLVVIRRKVFRGGYGNCDR